MKIGDTVRITGDADISSGFRGVIGKEGVIVAVKPDSPKVAVSLGGSMWFVTLAANLTIITTADKVAQEKGTY